MTEPKPTSLLRYVAPNAVTCTGLVVGLLSIMHTMAGMGAHDDPAVAAQEFTSAAWLILLCTLLDKLDGTVARLLKASSKFGVELDSFSDFTTFGVAPAVLLLGVLTTDPRYSEFYASDAGLWFVRASSAFLIVVSALRLAKFNVLTEKIGSRLFMGIPTTLVGALVSSFLLTAWHQGWSPRAVAAVPIALWVVGLWMVSNIPLPKMHKTSSMAYNIFMGINAALTYVFVPFRLFPEYLLLMSSSYAILGTIFAMLRMRETPDPSGPAKA